MQSVSQSRGERHYKRQKGEKTNKTSNFVFKPSNSMLSIQLLSKMKLKTSDRDTRLSEPNRSVELLCIAVIQMVVHHAKNHGKKYHQSGRSNSNDNNNNKERKKRG